MIRIQIALGLLVLGVTFASSDATITVISSLCQVAGQEGQSSWMKCPQDSRQRIDSAKEFIDNINYKRDDQKYCCGSGQDRFCCSLEAKLKEIPGFDPTHHNEDGVRYRFHRPSIWGFWHYLFMMGILFGLVFVILWVFGCVVYEILYCLCCCCFWNKDKKAKKAKGGNNNNNAYRGSSGKANPYPDDSENSTLVVINTAVATPDQTQDGGLSRPGAQPRNYQAIRTPLGGTADLYQNITHQQPPPSYNTAVEQPANVHV